jgi:predicted cytidylate kinase
MIVTIGGPPGSGKTTVARQLASDCNLFLITSGNIFREMAERSKMSLEDFGRFSETDERVDIELDEKVIDEVKERSKDKDVVVDGRLAAHMVERKGLKAFKVWIDAPLDVRVGRIAGREGKSLDRVRNEIMERERSERARYERIYGIDLTDTAIYDLTIDSRDITPKEVVGVIREKVGI